MAAGLTSSGEAPPCSLCGGSGWAPVESNGQRGVVPCPSCRPLRANAQQAWKPRTKASPTGPPVRAVNQRSHILQLLREAGASGVVNTELYRVCFRPPSRICELRQQGYSIRTIRESESRFRFVLLQEPDQPRPLREPRPPQMPLFRGRRR